MSHRTIALYRKEEQESIYSNEGKARLKVLYTHVCAFCVLARGKRGQGRENEHKREETIDEVAGRVQQYGS
jgi:hypothetical protein